MTDNTMTRITLLVLLVTAVASVGAMMPFTIRVPIEESGYVIMAVGLVTIFLASFPHTIFCITALTVAKTSASKKFTMILSCLTGTIGAAAIIDGYWLGMIVDAGRSGFFFAQTIITEGVIAVMCFIITRIIVIAKK